MTKRKKVITLYEKLSFKEKLAMNPAEVDKLEEEYIEELKLRGDYNENSEFIELLNKACERKS